MLRNDSDTQIYQKPLNRRQRRPVYPHHRQENTKILKVFLVGIGYNFTDALVHNFFARRYQSILRVDLVKQKKRPKFCKGSGFIELTDPEDLRHILATEEFRIKGRAIMAKEYKKGSELETFKKNVEKRRLFVHGLDPVLTDSDLRNYFSEVVELENAYIIDNSKFEKRGGRKEEEGHLVPKYGFVTTKTVDGAEHLLRREHFQIGRFCARVEAFDSGKKPQEGWRGAKNCQHPEGPYRDSRRQEASYFRGHLEQVRSSERAQLDPFNSNITQNQRKEFLDFEEEKYQEGAYNYHFNDLGLPERHKNSSNIDHINFKNFQHQESPWNQGYSEGRSDRQYRHHQQAEEDNHQSQRPINTKNNHRNFYYMNSSSNEGYTLAGRVSQINLKKKKKNSQNSKNKSQNSTKKQKKHQGEKLSNFNFGEQQGQFIPESNLQNEQLGKEALNGYTHYNHEATGFNQLPNGLEAHRNDLRVSFLDSNYSNCQNVKNRQRTLPERQIVYLEGSKGRGAHLNSQIGTLNNRRLVRRPRMAQGPQFFVFRLNNGKLDIYSRADPRDQPNDPVSVNHYPENIRLNWESSGKF